MCSIRRITSANRTTEKKECSVALTIAQICQKLYGPAEVVAGTAGPPLSGKWALAHLGRETVQVQVSVQEYSALSALSFRWLLSCIRRVDLSGSDAGFENLWLRTLKVTKVTKLIFNAIGSCHLLLSKWHHRTRNAKHQFHDLIKHFRKKADVAVVDQRRSSNWRS